MGPRFIKGTLLVIDPHRTPIDGDFVITQYPNTAEAALRELLVDGPSQLLLSLIPNTEKETLDSNIDLLGVLVKSIFIYHN